MPSRCQSEAENVAQDQRKKKTERQNQKATKSNHPALIIIKLGRRLGLVAQLVERRLCKAEALGPNPSKSIENAHTEENSAWKG